MALLVRSTKIGLLTLVCSVLLCSSVWAQQAIINLPSADITPKGQPFLMNESQLRWWQPDANWKATNFFTYGIGHNTELAITNFNMSAPQMNNLSVAFGFKSAIPILKKKFPEREVKLTVGSMIPVSLQGNGVGSYGYSHLSFRVPKFKTRLSAGINAGTDQVFDRDIVSFIGGVEHPIGKQLNVIMEYYSGTHGFAGTVFGMVFHHHKSNTVWVAGYRIPPNLESGRDSFVFEVGKFFGKYHAH